MPCHSDSSQPMRQRIMGAVSDAAGRSVEGKLSAQCVFPCASAHARLCVTTACVTVCMHVCQSEGMDACQRREQHHVRVLADDAHFRYTNSNSQLSHETISSHDSSTPFLCALCASAGHCKVLRQPYLRKYVFCLKYSRWLPSEKQLRVSEFVPSLYKRS